MKVYVAYFYGDLEIAPMADSSLEDLLNEIVKETGWGRKIPNYDQRTHYTPDPEDDKIEIWECDGQNKTCKVVWGFYGWHWNIPVGMKQGILPGHKKSLYELAMEGY